MSLYFITDNLPNYIEFKFRSNLVKALLEHNNTVGDPNLSSIPYRTVPYRTVPYRTVPYRTVPYRTVPYRTVPYRTVPLPYRTVPYRTVPYPTVPYRTVTYRFPLQFLSRSRSLSARRTVFLPKILRFSAEKSQKREPYRI
jgi:hypothetical protein